MTAIELLATLPAVNASHKLPSYSDGPNNHEDLATSRSHRGDHRRPVPEARVAIRVAVHRRSARFTGVRAGDLSCGANAHEPR